MQARSSHVIQDAGILVLSITLAVILVKTGILEDMLVRAQEWRWLGSFLAGIFFVSIFTAAPAAIALVEIFQLNPLFETALFASMGALLGDLVIFRFIKNSVAQDIAYLVKKTKQERFTKIFCLKLFGWLVPFMGALVVASPLPDEIGLAMMGIARMKTRLFITVVFVLDFVGLLIVGLITKGFL